MELPKIMGGNAQEDHRGKVLFNNDFDVADVKRIYFIENKSINIVRAWQGHKIEQRWMSAVRGCFEIQLIKIDNWESPDKNLLRQTFELNADKFTILHVPKGYVTSIKAKSEESKLMLMSDFLLNEINDEYRFPAEYFLED